MRLTENLNFVAIRDTLTKAATISRVKYTQQDLLDFLYTIDQINALDEDTAVFQAEALDDWKVDEHFEGFFYPAKVGVKTQDRATLNLKNQQRIPAPSINWMEKVRETDSDGKETFKDVKHTYKAKTLSKSDFMQVQAAIVASFRKAPIFNKSVANLRGQDLQLADVWDTAIDKDGWCGSDGSGMDNIPVTLTIKLSELVRDYKLVFTERTVMDNFLARWRANVLSK